jgi:cytidylate kinase
MPHNIIAIDGPSASGKGTLARQLADALNYAYLDTGAVYRLVAKRILDTKADPENTAEAIAAASWIERHFELEQLQHPSLRTDEVAAATSKASAHPEVRAILMAIQRNFAAHPPRIKGRAAFSGAVLDGRDIGTVVCPDAGLKLYVTASPEIRAERRFKELQNKGFATTYEAVLQDMRERDARDSGRSTAPLKPAEDAVLFDTSDLTADKALEKALHLVRQTLV